MSQHNIVELEIKIREQEIEFGADHPRLAEPLSQLAHLYFVFDRQEDAERALWRAVSICGKWFGQERLETASWLNDLGYLYETQARWGEAEHVYRLAYAIRCINLGGQHRDTLQTARNIVTMVKAQGKSLPERELERLAKVGH